MIIVVVCVFFALSAILKKDAWRKRMFWIGFGMLLFFSNEFFANMAMRAWELEATPFSNIRKKYELGIVLTGVTMGVREPNDRVYFNKGADRVTHAVQLYKLGHIRRILISGGSGKLTEVTMREADELKKAFLLMGVPDEDLLIENESRNTYESSVKVKAMLGDSIPASDCLLITSAFHMRRSLACFAKAGIPMDTFSTDFYSHAGNFTANLFIPQLDGLILWQKLIKEWVGLAAYKLAGYA